MGPSSLTWRERRNPPPRQKSCVACIKAKRRCDGSPEGCGRCRQRGLTCVFQGRRENVNGQQPAAAAAAAAAATAAAGGTPPNYPPPPQQQSQRPPPPPTTTVLAAATATTTVTSESSCDAGLPDMMTGSEFLFDPQLDPAPGLVSTAETTLPDFTSFDFSLDDMPMELMQHPMSNLPTPTKSKSADPIPDQLVDRYLWLIDNVFKPTASNMAFETRTLWSHAHLYKDGMPRSIQDAQSTCALYLTKNEMNARVVFRSIESRVADLLSYPAPATFQECLAHTQSLILYTTIRLFDGDVRARASAVHQLDDLDESAMRLLPHIRFDTVESVSASAREELPLYPLTMTKAFWKDWIQHESARRTFLFAFYLIQVYRSMADNKAYCGGNIANCRSMTLSAHLWNADGPVEFAEAWREKNHFVVFNAQFDEVLREARTDDIDGMGKMLLSSLLGVEEAKGLLASRTGSSRVENVGVIGRRN